MIYSFVTENREETQRLGPLIAKMFAPGDVVLLKGDLGAGKTTLTGGVAKGLSIDEDVISPTFNIMKGYRDGSLPLYHIDAYRLEGQNIDIGLDEYIEGDGVTFIEWPDFIAPLIPDERLEIVLEHAGGDRRKVTISSNSKHFDEIVEAIKEEF